MKRNIEPDFFERGPDLLARVPLAGDKGDATLDAGDYWRLVDDLKLSPTWFYSPAAPTRSYVCLHHEERLIPVARLIMGARRGEVVRYRDGDRLNLQRCNLLLTSGPARSDCASLLEPPVPADEFGRPLDW